MDKTYKNVITGIIIVSIFIVIELIFLFWQQKERKSARESVSEKKSGNVFFLAFGDVNLGRKLGEKIAGGDIAYPFKKLDLRQYASDIIFVNLESQLSSKNKLTVDPKNNMIFKGPANGISSLAYAGINLVSTANNHAIDFGKDVLFETIDNLKRADILFAGTSKQKENVFLPLFIEKNNIKFAIFAITAFVNFSPKNWQELVASADTVKLLSQFAQIRDSVDFIILSYHGGGEYANMQSKDVEKFAKWCLEHGADLFLGHHPHVSMGITKIDGKYIVYSLGNFIFYQPQYYWTQRSYGIQFKFSKQDTLRSIDINKLIPLKVSLQTEVLTDSVEIQKLILKTQKLSNIHLLSYWK